MTKQFRNGVTLCLATILAAVAACHRTPIIAEASNQFATTAVDCRTVSTLLYGTGKYDGYPRMAGPLWRIRACPIRGADMLATLLDSSRQISDTGVLQRRTMLTQYVHDARLLEMALSVMQDSTATVPARLAAMRTVIWMKTPGMSLWMGDMLNKPSCGPPCYSSYEGHYYRSHFSSPLTDTIAWPLFAREMQRGYVQRIDSILLLVSARVANPIQIRAAATFAKVYPTGNGLRGR